jgi:hypothetical protein
MHIQAQHPHLLSRYVSSSGISAASQQSSIVSFGITQASDSGLRNAFNHRAYVEALILLLTRRRIPFSAVEWPEWKELALSLNPAVEDFLITSRRTVMRYINATYTLYAEQLREKLQVASSMIHFSTDLWTSPHRHAMLAICVQWVDETYQLQKALLGLPECRHSHGGKAQAAVIAGVFRSFNLKNIGYYTGDNAISNDTCLSELSALLATEEGVSLLNGYGIYMLIRSRCTNSTRFNAALDVSVTSSICPYKPFFLLVQKKLFKPPSLLLKMYLVQR